MSVKPATDVIKDAAKTHWVYRAPKNLRPYLQLSRFDRPIGYWLLTLPGWIGLAFASLSHGFAQSDLKWAALILIGAIAMRGAGCTYNDIVDQDLDAKVERTALRPLPAGTISVKQAWIWLLAQCAVGLIVLLCLPRLAQIISLCSIPLVAAYPFMKRITWWPQVWLGMTFNWAVLVAYAAKTGEVSGPLFILYFGLIFWTVGYDTIYACQDIADDAMIGVKSTARRFGKRVKLGVGICYGIFSAAYTTAFIKELTSPASKLTEGSENITGFYTLLRDTIAPYILQCHLIVMALPLMVFGFQLYNFHREGPSNALNTFKSNIGAGLWLTVFFLMASWPLHLQLAQLTNP